MQESELGFFRKAYKKNETAFVYALCAMHEKTGSKYSVAWVKYDNKIKRCVFTYKGKKLIFDWADFFVHHRL